MCFLLIAFLLALTLFPPATAVAQHNHHGSHHDHETTEGSDDTGDPEIDLNLRLMTSQQHEQQGNFGFLLHLDLGWDKTTVTVFAGLGAAREGQLITGLTFTEGIEVEYQPVEEFGLFLGGVYHNGPFEDTVANAGILEGGIEIIPIPILRLNLSAGLSGLGVKETGTENSTVKTEELVEEEHHHPFLLPAIHGGHPEHVEEGAPAWFVSAEMRINLWRSP